MLLGGSKVPGQTFKRNDAKAQRKPQRWCLASSFAPCAFAL